MRNWQWSLAFIVSLVIHGAIASLYLKTDTAEPFGAAGAGEGGIEVGLGMQGSYMDSEPSAQNEPIESEKQAEPKPEPPAQNIDETLAEKPDSVEKPTQSVVETPVDPVAETPAEPSPDIDAVVTTEPLASAALPETKTSQPLHEDDKPAEVVPEKKPSTQDKVANTDKSYDVAEPNKASSSERMSHATGIANNRPVGGKVGNAKTYLGHLMAWLNKYKKYPVEAKKQRLQGTVKLQFTLDRQGQILDYKINESSGNTVLDNAALEMLRAAAPLPAMPDDFYPERQQMPLVIPVEYSLKTNRFL